MRRIFPLVMGLTAALPLQAQPDDWRLRLDAQMLGMVVNDSGRQTTTDAGLFLTASQLDRREFALGADWVHSSDNSGAAADYSVLYLSGREHFYSDFPAGRFTLRLDGYTLDSSDAAVTLGEGTVLMPLLAFSDRDGAWSTELGYAQSRYTGLTVDQWTPAFGFAPAWGEWLHARAYLNSYSDPALAQGLADSSAFDLAWSHTCAPGNCLGAGSVWLTLKGGERVYAVDPDAASVANRADLMTNGLSLGARWRLNPAIHLILVGGGQQYEDRTADTRYPGAFAYIDLSHQW